MVTLAVMIMLFVLTSPFILAADTDHLEPTSLSQSRQHLPSPHPSPLSPLSHAPLQPHTRSSSSEITTATGEGEVPCNPCGG